MAGAGPEANPELSDAQRQKQSDHDHKGSNYQEPLTGVGLRAACVYDHSAVVCRANRVLASA